MEEKYGMLTVVKKGIRKNYYEYYLCRCECGNYKEIKRYYLKTGRTVSCGCIKTVKGQEIYGKTNRYEIKDDYVIGYSSNKNSEFFISIEDYNKIKPYCWQELSTGYIAAWINKRITLLHRFIMEPPGALVVDHINHNKKDNRRNNLRICTQRANSNNRNQKAKGITIRKCGKQIYYVVQMYGHYQGVYKNLNEAEELRNYLWENNPYW